MLLKYVQLTLVIFADVSIAQLAPSNHSFKINCLRELLVKGTFGTQGRVSVQYIYPEMLGCICNVHEI